jgi:hypothetical protein
MSSPIETMTPAGAARLVGQIKAYWAERGLKADPLVIEQPGVGHIIRSSMVNGWPSR